MLLVYFLLFNTDSKNTPTVTLNTCPGTPRMTFYYDLGLKSNYPGIILMYHSGKWEML